MNIDDEAAVFGGIDETNKPGPRGFKNMKFFLAEPQGLSSARRASLRCRVLRPSQIILTNLALFKGANSIHLV